MAKQPSQVCPRRLSAGGGAAAVSGKTDTVAAAEPKAAVAEPAAVADHAVADDNVLAGC